ncbi:hypothetical protein, partial [Schaalia hyovaginalis]|uniref:hypothetical protein n=1 Tax=Schaalia hyovaginalis TaxID=29316 RepID=UPI0018A6C4F0
TLASLASTHSEAIRQLADARERLDAAQAALLAEKDENAMLKAKLAVFEAQRAIVHEVEEEKRNGTHSQPREAAPRSLLRRILKRSQIA